MSTWADTTALAVLAAALGRTGDSLRQESAAAVTLLGVHGYSWAASVTGSSLEWATTWATEWQASLRTRIAMLEAADAVPLAGALRWAPLHVDRRRLAAHGLLTGGGAADTPGRVAGRPPAGSVEAGRRLAAELIDALESGRAAGVLGVLDALDAVAGEPATTVAFFARLDLDMLQVFPAMVTYDLGVELNDLHRYYGPMGRALATAGHAAEPALRFDGADLMSGEAGSSLGPAVYFDFGRHDPELLVDAAVAFLPTFDEAPLMLAAPHYELPDGGYAGDDPRASLLRAVDAAGADLAVELVTRLDAAGALGSLIDPATAWRPEAAALVGSLLRKIGAVTGDERPTAAADHAIGLVIADTGAALVDPAVAAGLAGMVGPQIAALAEPSHAADLAASNLRAELDEIDPGRTSAVPRFVETVVRHDEARRALSLAVAALVVETLRDTFDPGDVGPTMRAADDLGAAWALVNGAALRADLDEAGRRDGDLGLAVMMTTAAAAVAALPAGPVTGVALGVAPGVAATLFGPDADATEGAFRDGFRRLHAVRAHATFVLATILHERGLIRLPAQLLDGEHVVVPTSADDWASLAAAVEDSEFDPQLWFVAVDAIVGSSISDSG